MNFKTYACESSSFASYLTGAALNVYIIIILLLLCNYYSPLSRNQASVDGTEIASEGPYTVL